MILAKRVSFNGRIAASVLIASLIGIVPAHARYRIHPPRSLFAPGLEIPLPPKRPPDLIPPPEAEHAPAQPETTAPDPACARVLASARLVATSIAPIGGSEGCGIATPVKLAAVVLADGTHVLLEPPATIRCTLAEALGDWVRDDIAPLAEKTGSGLSKLIGSEGYECRPRNRVEGAKLSEHGKGNAYDLLGVALHNGQKLMLDRQTEARDFMSSLKSASCARFMTVLGPGSDGYHESHLHVDLAERHSGYKICQWDLK
ncbi:extensin family protein [Methyloferula stellata]|uniref:extensin-like domain-containing protein n=1 Tax=Methyloferula stellata TaxID=876270 RepID=UPI00036A20FB|nr:extensin family protein [Methyloferula stellata]